MEKKATALLQDLIAEGVNIQISKYDLQDEKQTTLGVPGTYPIASLYKFVFLLEALEKKGEENWKKTVTIAPDTHASGFGILRGWPDHVTTTLENLAYLAMFHSDGTAAEKLFNSHDSPFRISVPFSAGKTTEVTMHHDEMVRSVNSNWPELSSDLGKRGPMRVPRLCGGQTSAEDFVEILRDRALPLLNSSRIFRTMAEPRANGPIRPARRMFGALESGTHFFGKTGTLGFGYVLNDSGIIFKDGKVATIVAVTSYGWKKPIEAAELQISNLARSFLGSK